MRARDPAIDALRGLALFDVALQNWPAFTHSPLSGFDGASPVPGWHDLVPVLIDVLGRTKAWTLLAGLLGAGVAWQADDADFGRRHAARVGFLLVLGVVHTLAWPGDILVTWAIVLVILGFAVRASDRALLAAVAVSTVGCAVLDAVDVACLTSRASACWPVVAREHARVDVLRSHDVVRAALVAWSYLPESVLQVLGASLAGVLFARRGRRGRWPLLVVGLAIEAVRYSPRLGLPGASAVVASALGAIGPGLFVLGAVDVLARLRPRLPRTPALEAVGRTSLSTYLCQTVAFTVLVGAGARRWPALPVAVVVFGVQALVAEAVVRRWSTGPMEAVQKYVQGVGARSSAARHPLRRTGGDGGRWPD